MKTIEKVAVVLIVLWCLSRVTFLTNIIAARMWPAEQFGQLSMSIKAAGTIQSLLVGLVSVGVAVWLYIMAKRTGASPAVWTMLGLFFGLIAAVLFYLGRIYDKMESAPVADAITELTGRRAEDRKQPE